MRKPLLLRAELVSVLTFVGKRAVRARPAIPLGAGILSELASGRGLR
jgi:hypothetical protein